MRTTVDLPPALHARAKALAAERGTSLSAVIADLTARGLAGLGEPIAIRTHPDTAWPTVDYGRPLSSAEVADLLDDE
jgi:hypothetical protein